MVPLGGNPWFVLADAAHALEYAADKGKGGNSFYNCLRGIAAEHYRSLNKRDAPDDTLFTGRTARMVLISEPGLYELIGRSEKPEARVFKDWVYGEVLPTISSAGGACKAGGYVLQGADRATVGATSG